MARHINIRSLYPQNDLASSKVIHSCQDSFKNYFFGRLSLTLKIEENNPVQDIFKYPYNNFDFNYHSRLDLSRDDYY